jgi:hypothetical protein
MTDVPNQELNEASSVISAPAPHRHLERGTSDLIGALEARGECSQRVLEKVRRTLSFHSNSSAPTNPCNKVNIRSIKGSSRAKRALMLSRSPLTNTMLKYKPTIFTPIDQPKKHGFKEPPPNFIIHA